MNTYLEEDSVQSVKSKIVGQYNIRTVIIVNQQYY